MHSFQHLSFMLLLGLGLSGPLFTTRFPHLGIDLLPQLLVLVLSVGGEGLFILHLDHTVRHSLSLCAQSIIEGLKATIFHVLWP